MSRTTHTLEQRIEAAPSAVFRAFTNATALREWLCDAAMVVPRKGGRLHLWWTSGYHATGDFTKVVPDERVSFTWHGKGEPAPTRVRVALGPTARARLWSWSTRAWGRGRSGPSRPRPSAAAGKPAWRT